MKWYYPPTLGEDLSRGFESFEKHDDSQAEHLDSLLKAIIDHEQHEEKSIDAHIVTWRGMMTKVNYFDSSDSVPDAYSNYQIMAAPFEDRDGYVKCMML